jgi:predicted RNA-binding protein with PIN domain
VRHRNRRRGRPHDGEPGGGLTADLSRLLRPALELALDVTRAGRELTPSLPLPRPVERVLGFARLSTAAWDDLRRAVDGDEAFRARVALVAEEDDVGRAGWLWLNRPDGWERELAELAASATAERTSDLAAAERRARREAEREAKRRQRSLEEERDALRADLGAADDARRRAEAAAAAIEAEAGRLRDERLAAVRRAADAERRLAAKGAEAKALAQEVERLLALAGEDGERDDVAAGPAGVVDGGAEGGSPAPTPDAPEDPAGGLQPDPRPRQPSGVQPVTALDPWADVDRRAVAGGLASAARAAADLAGALADLVGVVGGAAESGVEEAAGDAPAARDGGDPRTGRAQRAGRVTRRRALRLPGGVEASSPEAAAWLVRQPATVIVDGYNVSRSVWDDLPLPEQRDRLLDALEELEARASAAIHVVFDGADPEASSAVRRRGRRGVRVTFSPDGTEADDVIVDLVAAEPPTRPVVVATSDGAVRSRSSRLGANVVSAGQLLAVLGR